MSILIDKDTKVITQGITGATGLFHAQGARDYGTRMVGGVTPGKGGNRYRRLPGLQHRRRRRQRDRRQRLGHLCPADRQR